jgi:hypothetical protein
MGLEPRPGGREAGLPCWNPGPKEAELPSSSLGDRKGTDLADGLVGGEVRRAVALLGGGDDRIDGGRAGVALGPQLRAGPVPPGGRYLGHRDHLATGHRTRDDGL